MELNILEEYPLEDFKWKSFSSFEAFKYKIHTIFNSIFCRLFNEHDWVVLITPWNFDNIDNLENFRLHCAKSFKCSCCEKIVDRDTILLSSSQELVYNFYTKKYFKYYYRKEKF